MQIFDLENLDINLHSLLSTHIKLCRNHVSIDFTRGLPSPEQVRLSDGLLTLPAQTPFNSTEGADWKNYGGLQGLLEVRKLFCEPLLGLPPEQVAIGGNSSLELMHEAMTWAVLHGVGSGMPPWSSAGPVKVICPVPGYDRHFAICEHLGVQIIPVEMTETGPDMDTVERLVAQDASIKAIWCVPKYNNPCGTVYSQETVARLARMKCAAPDFRLFWDNAYAIHHFTDREYVNQPISRLCDDEGYPDRPLLFASTSKITIPGAGISFFGSSVANMRWWLHHRQFKTIGPDKVNQIRHWQFFKTPEALRMHMRRHRNLLQGKFELAQRLLETHLSDQEGVRWSKPEGGYFINLEVPDHGTRIVELARQAGLKMLEAGSGYPAAAGRNDSQLRLPMTYLDNDKLETALSVLIVCTLLALLEKNQQRLQLNTSATSAPTPQDRESSPPDR